MRHQQLTRWPYLKDLERWSKYCWIPVDIPRFDYPDIVEWVYSNTKPIVKVRPDISSPLYGNDARYIFDAVDVLAKDEHVRKAIQKQSTFSINLHQEFSELFPEMWERIMFELPITYVKRIMFWTSVSEVPFHRDETDFIDCPNSFRIMLHDTNPKPTLRLIENPISARPLPPLHVIDFVNDPNNKTFAVPPIKTTNTTLWNNFRVMHGSVFEPTYKKIIVIVEPGIENIDIPRFHKMMERSVAKYEQYAMISTRPRSDYIA